VVLPGQRVHPGGDPVNAVTQAFVTRTTGYREFGKVTWQMSQSHKAAFSISLDQTRDENQGLDSQTQIEAGYTFERGGPTLTLKETAVFSRPSCWSLRFPGSTTPLSASRPSIQTQTGTASYSWTAAPTWVETGTATTRRGRGPRGGLRPGPGL